MAESPLDEFFKSSLGLVVLALFLLLAIVVTPLFLIGAGAYVIGRLYLESPARLERLAREETETLYRHALSGTVTLTDEELDDAMART